MKKPLLLVLALGAIILGAKAQMNLTPKIGFHSSTMSFGSDYIREFNAEPEARFGATRDITAGLALDMRMGKHFSFQPEILFVRKGYRTTNFLGLWDYRFNYLETPLLLKTRFTIGENWQVFGYAGPYIGYGLNGRLNAYSASSSSSTVYRIWFRDQSVGYSGNNQYISKNDGRRFELSAVIGAGISRRWGVGSLSVEARYGRSFTDLYKWDRSRFRSFSVLFGYSVPLKKQKD
jgi:hypothetical protein